MDIKKEIEIIKKYVRATNYLSVAQIFLKDNYLLERPLKPDDIKPRLLGHWGTCPGINFLYANLNNLVKKHKLNMIYLVGPGHGFPAIQSNLFLEKTLIDFYPQATLDERGISYIAKEFSWPYGFPSHAHPGSPGVILEGGELGYALSTAFGAVLDNPDMIATCLIGDGEAETGPTATAWHLNKFLDPKTSGAVLPVVHLNGYKISGPTVYGRMDNKELNSLFEGYGYEPLFIDGESEDQVYENGLKIIELAYQKIKNIQNIARSGKEVIKPKWPMIIMRTPKGWTGIKEIHNNKIEGNHYSHQVVVKNPRIDKEELEALENWMRSYSFEELFDKDSGFIKDIELNIPEDKYKIGKNKHTLGGPDVYKPLELPDPKKYEVFVGKPSSNQYSNMKTIAEYLKDVFADNKNIRLFSPDETYSNKLDKIFDVTTRSFMWPHEDWDEDMGYGGQVIEMLSEHSLQGLMQGYVLTGRHGIFASYEAFIQIVSSMADQYAKFMHQTKEYSWRGQIPSLNYILTSSGWRQDHNGFSHQNPGFIDDMLQRQGDFINVYFPADQNSALVVMDRALKNNNGINVIVTGKQDEPAYIDIETAQKDIEKGLAIWDFASDNDPDIVFASVGDYLTQEALAGITLLKEELANVKVRFVNITTMSFTGFGEGGNVLPKENFADYFTSDKPVIFNYHGYPQTIKQIIFDYVDNTKRFDVNGYNEIGSTTTPFDMQVRNGTSRYHMVMDAARMLAEHKTISNDKRDEIIKKYENKIQIHKDFIKENGYDLEEITEWKWKK